MLKYIKGSFVEYETIEFSPKATIASGLSPVDTPKARRFLEYCPAPLSGLSKYPVCITPLPVILRRPVL